MRKIRSTLPGMFKHSRSGSVMVEFALCIPFLITLLYVVVDAYNYYYWSNKVKNCTYIVAGLLQNTYKKQEGTAANSWYKKGLEPSDIKNICKAAMLSIPIPSKVMNAGLADKKSDVSKYPVPIICIVCFEGTSDSGKNAAMLWEIDYKLGETYCYYKGNGSFANADIAQVYRKIKPKLGESFDFTSQLFSGFSIPKGERKIWIFVYMELPSGYTSDQARKYFGFHLIKPSICKDADGSTYGYFLNMLAFTPAPGLFSKTIDAPLH